MSMSIGDLAVTLSMNASSFEKGIATGLELAEKLGDALFETGRKSIEAAADFRETSNIIQQSFGASAESINKWAQDTGGAMQRTQQEIRSFAGVYQTMLSTMLGSKEAAEPMSKALTQLSVDMASFFNVADERMFDAVKSGMVGMSRPLEQFGIVMTDAALNSYLLKNGIHETMQTLDEASKVQVRYNFLMDSTTIFQGDAVRTSNDLVNMQKALSARFQETSLALGQQLLPQAKEFVNIANDMMTVLSGGDGMAEVLTGIGSALRTVADMALQAAEGFTVMANALPGINMDATLQSIRNLRAALAGEGQEAMGGTAKGDGHTAASGLGDFNLDTIGLSPVEAATRRREAAEAKREEERKAALSKLHSTKAPKGHLGADNISDSQQFDVLSGISGPMGAAAMFHEAFGKNWIDKVLTPLQKEELDAAQKKVEYLKKLDDDDLARDLANDALLGDIKMKHVQDMQHSIDNEHARLTSAIEKQGMDLASKFLGGDFFGGLKDGLKQVVHANANGAGDMGEALGLGNSVDISKAFNAVGDIAVNALSSLGSAAMSAAGALADAAIQIAKTIFDVTVGSLAPKDQRLNKAAGIYMGAGGFLNPTAPIAGIMSLATETKSFQTYQAALTKGIDRVIKGLEPLFKALWPVAGLFIQTASSMGMLLTTMIPGPGFFHAVFEGAHHIASGLAWAAVAVFDFKIGLEIAIAGILAFLDDLTKGKIDFLHDAKSNAVNRLHTDDATRQGLIDNAHAVTDMTAMSAAALASADALNALTRSVTNMPSGYLADVAAARAMNANPVPGGNQLPDAVGGSGGPVVDGGSRSGLTQRMADQIVADLANAAARLSAQQASVAQYVTTGVRQRSGKHPAGHRT